MDEFDLIARYFRPLATSSGARSLTDDVARLDIDSRDGQLVVTTDALAEGIHFLHSARPADVGFKLMAVNVSDCLAKGALPRAASLVLAIPHTMAQDYVSEFACGLGQALAMWDCTLCGGDTVATSGPALMALTMHAQCVGVKGVVHRSGASADDDVWITGTLGDAGLGLLAAQGKLFGEAREQPQDWSETLAEHVLAAFNRPSLPLLEFVQVVSTCASASIDISDGLMADADKLAKASEVGITINARCLPLSRAAQVWRQAQSDDRAALIQLACSGEDYQTLFTAPVAVRATLEAASQRYGLSRIGTCTAGNSAGLHANGRQIAMNRLGWRHKWV